MKKIRSWFRRKGSKNDPPSGIATGERTENIVTSHNSHQFQHGGDSGSSQLRPPTREGEATAMVEGVNPGHPGNDSDSGTGSDVQHPERHQRPLPSSSQFTVLGVTCPRIDFDHLRNDYPYALHQITQVINANPLLKKDTTVSCV